MVFTIPTPKTLTSPTGKRLIMPAIEFARMSPKELRKDEFLTFNLRSNPQEETSSTYSLTIRYFAAGKPEELLHFLKDLKKVIAGQNVTTGPGKFALARRLLQGSALTAFNNAAGAETETNPRFDKALQGLIKHVFPAKAYLNQKRYMTRFLKKPRDLPVREFMARLLELNEYFKFFPPTEGNEEPKKLSQEEIMDIAEYAMPNNWQKAMMMHGFDPIAHSPDEFVEFCERIEFAEPIEQKCQTELHKARKKDAKERAKPSERGNSNKRQKGKWCEYHQTDSHDLSECKVMLAQAKRMRGTYEAAGIVKKSFNNNSKKSDEKKNRWTPKTEINNMELKELMMATVKECLAKQKEEENLNIDLQHFNLSDEENSDSD